jgi:predicted ArsR family transcriptional regulator
VPRTAPIREHAPVPAGAASERRAATQEEARALSHPLRLRILRLCKDEALTNKELATRLDLQPGTVLHHVRTLVATGFLTEEGARPGPRGTVEKPYLSTGKSWRLEVDEAIHGSALPQAVLDAVSAELEEAGRGTVIESARMAMRLRPEQLERLVRQIGDIIDEFGLVDEPDGEPLAMLMILHRRGKSGSN